MRLPDGVPPAATDVAATRAVHTRLSHQSERLVDIQEIQMKLISEVRGHR
jgi:hypothetical protein